MGVVVIFDIDGTLRDTMPLAMEAERNAARILGYDITEENQRRHRWIASEGNWGRYFPELGVREEDIPGLLANWYTEFNKLPQAPSIGGAKEALESTERIIGLRNIFFITNSSHEDVSEWFEGNGMEQFIPRLSALITVGSQATCKSDMIKTISDGFPHDKVVFIGDTISDFDSCWVAKEKGVENLEFWGILHKEGIDPDALVNYLEENQDMQPLVGRMLKSLDEIPTAVRHEHS